MRHALPGKPKDPFTAALDALRSRLGEGRLILGEPLTISELAHEMGLSATPVREALSRLAGEGLIEDRRGRGYFARRIDVADLVELYGLRRVYLLSAADMGPIEKPIVGAGRSDQSPEDRLAQIFDRLVAGVGNQALLEAYRLVCDRLSPAVQVERALFPLTEEIEAFEALASQAPQAWSQRLTAFHDIRQARSGDIVRAMRASANISSL